MNERIRRARHTTDARAFESLIAELVGSDPIGLSIVASNVARAASRSDAGDAAWLWVEEQGDNDPASVVAVAMNTPPFRPFIATTDADAATRLAELLATLDRPVAGVVGMVEGCRAFARRWKQTHPCQVVTEMRTGVYEMRGLRPPVGVTGEGRIAGATDEAVVLRWAQRFVVDIGAGHAEYDEDAMRDRLASGRLALWEVGGEPVSMAFANPAEGGVARVGWVYTPDEHRGNGYGSAVTAHVTRLCLARGERCMLHTDLANPTSNAIYQAIGYERIGSDIALRFDPVPTARQKVLRSFFDTDGRLIAMPAKAGKRQIVLDHIAQVFEVGVRYSETEVNELLLGFDDDCASLRRHLVDAELLAREAGVYWRSGGTVIA